MNPMTSRIRERAFCKLGMTAAAAWLAVLAPGPADAGFGMDDLAYWVGAGTNRAALVVDWDDGLEPVSLAWGFRWNGTATGKDMFEAVAAADARLFVLFRNLGAGKTVYGAGYDVDGDGGAFHPGAAGFGTETGYADDPDDHYEEGWYSQYWHYSLGVGAPYDGGAWISSGSGFEVRALEDGDWDGWRVAPVTFPPPASNPPPAECVAAPPAPPRPPAGAAGFGFREIEFWTGDGTNRAALVVDWHDGTRRHALAWGYRWDGEATARDMWQAVTNADPALSGMLSNTWQGAVLTACTYTRQVRHTGLPPGTAEHDVFHSAYACDHPAGHAPGTTWSHWTLDYTDVYYAAAAARTDAGLDTRFLADGSWDAWSRGPAGQARAPGWPSAALHYPCADAVVSYTPGSGVGFDWLTGHLFTNAAAALGRPTVDTSGDGGAIDATNTVPVVPVYPALRSYEVVSVGQGGALTVAFDHRVLDHPRNPYGVDLLVFGNAIQVIGGQEEWENGDPAATTVSGSCENEAGRVAVSQDGFAWHTLTNAYGDQFMPTLGRVYDPERPDTTLGALNRWWGGATDPTVPPDPRVAPADWQGRNVAELARRYRGSAGGTGFDIGQCALPVCPDTGHKWIRYVRIEPSMLLSPDIDAVTDVAPGSPAQNWAREHFAWMGDPAEQEDAADPDGDRIANLLEYGLGRDPTNAVYDAAYTVTLCTTSAPPRFLIEYAVATGAPDVVVETVRTGDLVTPDWRTNNVAWSAAGPPTNGVLPIRAETPVDARRAFVGVRVRHED